MLRNAQGVLRNAPDVLHNDPGVLRNILGVLNNVLGVAPFPGCVAQWATDPCQVCSQYANYLMNIHKPQCKHYLCLYGS